MTASSSNREPAVVEPDAARRRDQVRARHLHDVAALLGRRRDLRGVVPLADLVSDAARWSA